MVGRQDCATGRRCSRRCSGRGGEAPPGLRDPVSGGESWVVHVNQHGACIHVPISTQLWLEHCWLLQQEPSIVLQEALNFIFEIQSIKQMDARRYDEYEDEFTAETAQVVFRTQRQWPSLLRLLHCQCWSFILSICFLLVFGTWYYNCVVVCYLGGLLCERSHLPCYHVLMCAWSASRISSTIHLSCFALAPLG